MSPTPERQRCTPGHARRCRYAASPKKQCRCKCGGAGHGIIKRDDGLLKYLPDRDLLEAAGIITAKQEKKKKGKRR